MTREDTIYLNGIFPNFERGKKMIMKVESGNIARHSKKDYLLLTIVMQYGYGRSGKFACLRSLGYTIHEDGDRAIATYRFRGTVDDARKQLKSDMHKVDSFDAYFDAWRWEPVEEITIND